MPKRWSTLASQFLGRGDDRPVAPPRTSMDQADRRQLYAVAGSTLLVIILGAITFLLTS